MLTPCDNRINDIAELRSEISKERIIFLDFQYLCREVEGWWERQDKNRAEHALKAQLITLILQHTNSEDRSYFDKVGMSSIAGVSIINIFQRDDHRLALIVHEALSEIFHLKDIEYAYEEHKTLFLKPKGENYKDWGSGYGAIAPHSDDLYEDINTDYLSLTVCRDLTRTPTHFYFPKDIIRNFDDDELSRLLDVRCLFTSGKNVQLKKRRERKLVDYSEAFGATFSMDFRIDDDSGMRMLPTKSAHTPLLKKLRTAIKHCTPIALETRTGTFSIIANTKLLHARPQMRIDHKVASEFARNSSFANTPRLLYRSKGPREV